MDNSNAHFDLRRDIWELLNRACSVLMKHADTKLLVERGISYQQFMVLYMLDSINVTATATQLAVMLEKSTNTLSTILDRMEKSGLVKKVRDTKDRRLVHILMTPQGKKKLAEATELGLALIKELGSPFTLEELQTFKLLLEKLLKEANKVLVDPRMVRQGNDGNPRDRN